MNVATLMAAFTVGAALLALWSFARWPKAAPTRLAVAMLHALLAFGGLQLGLTALAYADALPRGAVPLAALAAVVPALTYAFLAGLWVLRLFSDALRNV